MHPLKNTTATDIDSDEVVVQSDEIMLLVIESTPSQIHRGHLPLGRRVVLVIERTPSQRCWSPSQRCWSPSQRCRSGDAPLAALPVR